MSRRGRTVDERQHIDLPDGLGGLAALFDPRRIPDPYPLYAQLRATRPVWQVDEHAYVLSRYDDCTGVLRDPRWGHMAVDDHDARRGRRTGGREGGAARSFLLLNPPDHTRLRRLVSRAFTPTRVTALGPRIEEIAAGLVERVLGRSAPVDLVAALASPLPVTVISELLGIPTEDRGRLVAWSDAMARGLDPAFLLPAEVRDRLGVARRELAGYLGALIAARRRSGGHDLIAALVAVSDGGDALSEEELVATCILLLVAGHETTTSLIASGVLAMVEHPDQLARLRAAPGLLPNAVEELLRHDPPVQLTARVALDDARIGDRPVAAGSFALLLIGAANRDPALCDDPDSLDIGRAPVRHLGLGQGIHYCLGAPLARLETQIALGVLLRRAGNLVLGGAPAWKDNTVLRGLRHLPVSVGPRGGPASA